MLARASTMFLTVLLLDLFNMVLDKIVKFTAKTNFQ